MLDHTTTFLPVVATLLAGTSMTTFANASPLFRRNTTQPVGKNPISNPKVEFLGFQTADNSCSHRDLGFTGAIAGKWYAIYGDTLWCKAGITDPNKDHGFSGIVRDSVSAMTNDPLRVHDLNLDNNQRQNQFVPFNAAWGETNQYGFGGTSLVETDASTGTGAVFYLINQSIGEVANLIGAGIAKVNAINGTFKVTERLGDKGFWWDAKSNPHYGDIAAFRDPRSEYIYAWGHPPSNATGVDDQHVYMIRVKASEAFDFCKYQYWWESHQGWKSDRLTTFTSDMAVMWGVGQGQAVWNAFYQRYIFVHMVTCS